MNENTKKVVELGKYLFATPDDLTYAYWGYRADQPDGFEFGTTTIKMAFPDMPDEHVLNVVRSTFIACANWAKVLDKHVTDGTANELLDHMQSELNELCKQWRSGGLDKFGFVELGLYGSVFVSMLTATGRLVGDEYNGTQYGFKLKMV